MINLYTWKIFEFWMAWFGSSGWYFKQAKITSQVPFNTSDFLFLYWRYYSGWRSKKCSIIWSSRPEIWVYCHQVNAHQSSAYSFWCHAQNELYVLAMRTIWVIAFRWISLFGVSSVPVMFLARQVNDILVDGCRAIIPDDFLSECRRFNLIMHTIYVWNNFTWQDILLCKIILPD